MGSAKNQFLAPASQREFNIKTYLRFAYFWPSILQTAANTICFEVGFQLIKMDDYPDFQPLAVISAISCFAPIFSLLLAIMLYWSTFRPRALYSRMYLFDKGRAQVRLTSLRSGRMYALVSMIDLAQMTIAVVSSVYSSIYWDHLLYLWENFPFGYYFFVVEIVVGLSTSVRLSYLIFPHILGHRYFRWRQTRDNLVFSRETSKTLLVFPYWEYAQDVRDRDPLKLDHQSFGTCKICGSRFAGQEDIVELVCEGEHIVHKQCADAWFNKQQHINCPVCLEFLLSLKPRRSPASSNYTVRPSSSNSRR